VTEGRQPADPREGASGDGVAYPLGDVLREITRGGLAGLVAGVIVAGAGGRLVMRLAALRVPGAAGALTENGNVIGELTVAGTLALVVFVGLFFGAVAGSIWVVISPWVPRRTFARLAVSVPVAVGLTSLGLIEGSNHDFEVLGHDAVVVALLVALVALGGPAVVLADRWLDGRLPVARRDRRGVIVAYGIVAGLGVLLTLLGAVPLLLGSDLAVAGTGLVVVGFATLVSWQRRIDGEPSSPAGMVVTARVALVVATGAGLGVAAREIAQALAIA
jgi:hypothetical protein